MFDVKQCEADGWKCEFTPDGFKYEPAEYLGKNRDGNRVLIRFRNDVEVVQSIGVRNIAKPKVKRWNTTISVSKKDTIIPLIEDSTGIRVDHSDAVIEALKGLNISWLDSHWKQLVEDVIAKIKKDRGE